MKRPTSREFMEFMRSLTAEESAYRERRAAEIRQSGGTLSDIVRIPYEEIVSARVAKDGAA